MYDCFKLSFLFLSHLRCVTHLHFQIINEQTVQECDATMLNSYTTVRLKNQKSNIKNRASDISFCSQALHRVGNCSFYCLETDGRQSNKHGQQTRRNKDPYIDVCPVSKIVEPAMHDIPRNGRCNYKRDQHEFDKIFESNRMMFETEAPSTLRTPISFVRCAVANKESPSSPRHAMKMAKPENMPNTFPKS